jgi:hypothetical protein
MLDKSQVKNSLHILLNSVEKSSEVSDFSLNSTADWDEGPDGKKPNGWIDIEVHLRLKLGV